MPLYASGSDPTNRNYVHIEADDDPGTIYAFDVDFLMSNWGCTWGTTCKCTMDNRPNNYGCCAFGVEVTKGDRRRIKALLPELRKSGLWANQEHGDEWGVWEKMGDGGWNTTITNGACVFMDQEKGCTLHLLAVRDGKDPWDYKPNECSIAPFFSHTIEEHWSGNDLVYIVPWDWWLWSTARDGTPAIDWACTYDAENYAEARTPVFHRFRRELEHSSSKGVVKKLEKFLIDQGMTLADDDPIFYPTNMKGDGRRRIRVN